MIYSLHDAFVLGDHLGTGKLEQARQQLVYNAARLYLVAQGPLAVLPQLLL